MDTGSIAVTPVGPPETEALPSEVAPSKKVTVPVGVTVPLPRTFAVRVSVWPMEMVGAERMRVVAVRAFETTTACAELALAGTFVSPRYAAVMLWLPTASDAAVKWAWAVPAVVLEPKVAEPMTVVPSRKLTVPVGVIAVVSETVAVRTTDCPSVMALEEAARVVVLDVVTAALP